MLFDDLDEVLDSIANIWELSICLFSYIGLLITSPVWIIPYLIIKAFKEKEDRENE